MKSYFASSVQLAMENARRELGSDAILVTSRLAPAEPGKPRRYEVVFATDTPEKIAPEQPRAAASETASPVAGPSNASLDAVLEEIKGLRQQIQTQFSQTATAGAGSGLPAGANSTAPGDTQSEILSHLIRADVNPDVAQLLLASALQRLANPPAPAPAGKEGRFTEILRAAAARRDNATQDLRGAVAASIASAVRAETGLAETTEQVVMAFIGPPGAGKTSAIAKIAARYGVGRSKPVLLVSADNLRVAASEQLRGYAAVLGLRFELAQSPRALGQLLGEHRGYDLVLIDTPGFSGADIGQATALAEFLAARAGLQKHLVMPAAARGAHLDRIFSAYEVFRPSHLLFSRMDESTLFGPVLNQAMVRGIPLSFFSTGAGVPEDLSEANAGFLADRLLPAETTPLNLQAAA